MQELGKSKCPTIGFQNENRFAITIAEYTTDFFYLQSMTDVTRYPHLNCPLTRYQLHFKPKNHHLLQYSKKKLPRPRLCPLTLSQITFSEQSSPRIIWLILSKPVLVSLSLISQYTCLSITAPTLQDHLRTIKRYHDAAPSPRPEFWKHDYKLADTKLAALNTMRSDLVKELVQSNASQVIIDRRQRLEMGVTALRAAELLKKVETVRGRIERSLKKKQERIVKHNSRIPHQPGSSHELNFDSPEVIDVDAIKTDDFDADEAAPPTRRQTIEDVARRVEGLANEVETIAEFMDIEPSKVGEEVQKLIPAWEAFKKEGDGKEERKGVELMFTELAEAMQAVRDGVETIQSITMYAEQADADEEAEMVKLRKEMALVRLRESCYVLPVPEFPPVIQLQGERRAQQADLQKVRAEIQNAHWELPIGVDQDEFIANIRARVENLIQPLLDQLEAAETNEERLFKSMCDQELEEKKTVEEAELNTAIADGRRRTNELIANALSTVAMVKRDVRESQRRQEARQAAQRSASANGQPRA